MAAWVVLVSSSVKPWWLAGPVAPLLPLLVISYIAVPDAFSLIKRHPGKHCAERPTGPETADRRAGRQIQHREERDGCTLWFRESVCSIWAHCLVSEISLKADVNLQGSPPKREVL